MSRLLYGCTTTSDISLSALGNTLRGIKFRSDVGLISVSGPLYGCTTK